MIIFISGKQRSGKDTFADYLSFFLKDVGETVLRESFAKPLKSQCRSQFAGVIDAVRKFGGSIPELRIPDDDNGDKSLFWRSMLQDFGESKKDESREHWTIQLLERIKELQVEHIQDGKRDPIFIVTDMRHKEEEFDYFGKEDGIKMVRVTRSNRVGASSEGHISEVGLDGVSNSYFNFVIENDGSHIDLLSRAKQVANIIFNELR